MDKLKVDKLKELLSIDEIDDTEGFVLHPGDLAKLLAYVKAGAELQVPAEETSDSGPTPSSVKQKCTDFTSTIMPLIYTEVGEILTEPDPATVLGGVMKQVLSNPHGPATGAMEMILAQAKENALERIPRWRGFTISLQGLANDIADYTSQKLTFMQEAENTIAESAGAIYRMQDVFFTMVRCGRVLEATFDFAIEEGAKKSMSDVTLVIENSVRIWKRIYGVTKEVGDQVLQVEQAA